MTTRLPSPFQDESTAVPLHEPENDPAEALIGRTIGGRYRVSAVLGRGGMGVVYGATHLDLQREVAVKVIPAQYTSDAEALRRFEQEARTASRIAHPNVVAVYDYGRLTTGEPYLVMERLDGRDLSAVLQERVRVSAREMLDALTPIAAALDAIHAQGMVHRDIKPSNVFFTVSGTVKLVDFGLAVLHEQQKKERLTRQGSVVGTAEYMAPEAARGVVVDARGDVYSLAVVAFELLAGEPPFVGAPVTVLIDKTSKAAPSLREIAGTAFPDALERVLARALEREPERRQASAGELLEELRGAVEASGDAVLAPQGVGAAPTSAPDAPRRTTGVRRIAGAPDSDDDAPVIASGRNRVIAAVAVAVSFLALIAGGVGWTLATHGDRHPTPATAAALTPTPPAPTAPPPASEPSAPEPSAPEPTAPEPMPELVLPAPVADPLPTAPEPPPSLEPAPAVATAREQARAERGPRSPGREVASSEPSRAEPPSERGAERAAELVREAQSALLRGELPRARSLYREATQASASHAPAWRGLGLASERLRLGPEAVRAYERYLRLAPGAPDAAAIRARIEALR